VSPETGGRCRSTTCGRSEGGPALRRAGAVDIDLRPRDDFAVWSFYRWIGGGQRPACRNARHAASSAALHVGCVSCPRAQKQPGCRHAIAKVRSSCWDLAACPVASLGCTRGSRRWNSFRLSGRQTRLPRRQKRPRDADLLFRDGRHRTVSFILGPCISSASQKAQKGQKPSVRRRGPVAGRVGGWHLPFTRQLCRITVTTSA
jgi:hypothetical protein